MANFRGVFTAIVTPFTAAGELDLTAFEKIAKFQLEQGIHGLVPCGTTGEAPTLSTEEKTILVKKCVELACKKVPVIAGASSNNTREACKQHVFMADLGATATLQACPWYNKPTQDGLYKHFKAISESSNCGIVLYNVPGRTASHLEVDTIVKLVADCKNIIAIKDADTNPLRIQRLITETKAVRSDFSILSGEDSNLLPILAMGGDGLISVYSNARPQEAVALFKACEQNEWQYAAKISAKVAPLIGELFSVSNPIPIKSMLAKMGYCGNNFRLPLTPLNEAQLAHFEQFLINAGWVL